jgi:hypothetical protein
MSMKATDHPSPTNRLPPERARPVSNRTHLLGVAIAVATLVELLAFAWLCVHGRESLVRAVTEPDTQSYVDFANSLLHVTDGPNESNRTAGYPLFLALCLLLGGRQWFYHVAIGLQLALNIALTAFFWKFFEQLLGKQHATEALLFTAIFFVGGLGTALQVLSDFQAGFLLAILLCVLLFGRRMWLAFGGGAAAALLVLTRPSFLALPAVLLLCALIVRRTAWRIPATNLAVIVVLSLVGVGLSLGRDYQTRDARRAGFLVFNARAGTCEKFGLGGAARDPRKVFEDEVGTHAGRPYEELTQTERSKYALLTLLRHVQREPQRFMVGLLRTLAKYTFVPLETALAVLSGGLYSSEARSWPRALLFVVFLPVWVLALVPPLRNRTYMPYYYLSLLFVGWILVPSALVSGQGERLRFPLLIFTLPLAAVNLRSILTRFTSSAFIFTCTRA